MQAVSSFANPASASPPGGLATRGWVHVAIFLMVAVAGCWLPAVTGNSYYLGLLVNSVILGIAALGIGFLMYQCGLVMFGVAAFIGLPAYLLGIASTQWNLPLMVSIAIALGGSLLFALLVGSLVVRARPLPFAMLTLALAQMLKSAATLRAVRPITGGEDGLPMMFSGSFFGLAQAELAKPVSFWPVAWLALCLMLALAWLASHSRFGQVLRATQANEERMRFSGFDTYRPRLAAFVLASGIVSVSGILLALNAAFASPDLLDFATGGHALVAMLVGGATTVFGPVLGAILFTWGQDAFGATGYLELLTGIAVVVMIVAFRTGASGFIITVWQRLQGGTRGKH